MHKADYELPETSMFQEEGTLSGHLMPPDGLPEHSDCEVLQLATCKLLRNADLDLCCANPTKTVLGGEALIAHGFLKCILYEYAKPFSKKDKHSHYTQSKVN